MFVWMSISMTTFWGGPFLVRKNISWWHFRLYKLREHCESTLRIFAANLVLESTPKLLLVSIFSDKILISARSTRLALTLKQRWALKHWHLGRGVIWHVFFRTTCKRADYVWTWLTVFVHEFFNSVVKIERLWVCMRVFCLLDGGSHLCLSNISVRAPTV